MVAALDRPTLGDLLTMSEAAALAGVHRNTIRTWCATGRLGFVRINQRGERRLRRDDLERLIAARRARAALAVETAARTVAGMAPARGATRRDDPPSEHPATARLAREQLSRGDALRRIAAEISSRTNLDKLFEDVIDDSFALFRVDLAGLWLYTRAEHPFELAAQRGLTDEILGHVAVLRENDRTTGLRAIHERRVHVLADDLGGTSPDLRRAYEQAGVRTVCFVPIVFRDEPLGLLVLYHRGRYDWSDDEIGLARGFADAMAAAIANARLYDSVRSLAARLDAIQDLGLRLSRLTDTAGIGEAIIAEAGTLLECDTIRVYRVDRATGWCEPIAFRGRFLGTEHPTAEMLRVQVGIGLTGWVAAHDEAVLVGDAARDPRGLVTGPSDEPESVVVVPMSFDSTVHGVIVVSRVGADRFTREDERTLSIFAGYAAQALINAEQLERVGRQQAALEHQLATQRRLLEVNERLLSTLDPQGVLEMIADSLRTVVAYDSLSIYRVDRERGVRRAVVARDDYADMILGGEYPLTAGINGWVFEHGEPVLANDVHLDPRSMQVPGTPFEPESMVVVPLVVNGEVIGTLSVGRMGGAEAHFSATEFELTKLFASQASIALRNAEAHGAVKVRAERDALTGLRNHGTFQRELGDALGASDGGAEAAFGLLMMDLDGFKAYNDALGHPAGDALLAEIAAAMQAAVRDGDALYRYGGDEFAAILPGATRTAAHEVAGRLRRAVTALSAGAADGLRVTVSVGVAIHPDDGRTKDELVGAADRALYLAKPSTARDDGPTAIADPYLAALDETALAVMDRLDPASLLETILRRAAALVGTPHGYIYLVDEADASFVTRVGCGVFTQFLGTRIPFGEGIAGRVHATGQPFTVDDYDTWSDRVDSLPRSVFGAVVGVPLTSGQKVVGVLGLASGDVERTFGERDVSALNRFAQLASIALDNARLVEVARRGALYDAVTGLPNRELLADRLGRALATADDDRSVAVVLLDLARFKFVNESLGHAGGDRLLVAVGERLSAVVRPGDTVARFGGDEFAIVVDGIAGRSEADPIAARILASLEEPFEVGGREWFMDASLGISVGRHGRSTPDELLREAEIALVRAKTDAGPGHTVFEPAMSADTLERIDLENDLRRAIDRGELRVHYQPIVDLADDRIVGLEALVRWQHPVRGLVPPLSFIPLAEESGLVVPLGRWVLETACREVQGWREALTDAAPLRVSINLSARQFAQPDLVDQVAAVLATTGLEPSSLELEITESVLMDESEVGTRTLRALRALGVRLALDDFGTGYSSLSYLKHLPLDTIKVDRTFIANLDRSSVDVPIVQAMIALAHGLGISVVGEGIETRRQRTILRELGCDMGQGFAYARPLVPHAVPDVLARGLGRRRARTR